MFEFGSQYNAIYGNQVEMNVHLQNLQNQFVPGYKAETVQFSDYYNEAMAGGGAKQKISGITFSQGTIVETPQEKTNLAINGNGFFVVSDGAESSKCSYTRDGRFRFNTEGVLVHSSGKKLMGYKLDESGNPVGDLVPISKGSLEADSLLFGGNFSDFKFDDSGTLYGQVVEVDPKTKQRTVKEVPIYKVAVASFANPSGLTKLGITTFSSSDHSGKAVVGISGQGVLGQVLPQSLEMSNVDFAQTSTAIGQAKINYNANMGAFKAVDKMTQSAIGLIK